MQVGLLGGALAVALVALVAWLAASRAETPGERERLAPAALLAGLGGAFLLFLLTLPARPPSSPGGQLGVGALVGAAFAALVAWCAARPSAMTAPAAAGALGGALAPAAILSLLYRGNPTYALLGALLGQAATLFFVEADAGDEVASGELHRLFLGTSAALAAGVALAIAQYAALSNPERLAVGGKAWWALPPLVLGALLVGALTGAFALRVAAARAVAATATAVALLALFALRLPAYWPLLLPPAMGFVTGTLVSLLATNDQRRTTNDERPTTREMEETSVVGRSSGRHSSLIAPLLGSLLLFGLLIAAYRLRTGLGIALAALGYAGALAVLPHSVAARRGLLLLALAALFRLAYAALDLEATSVYLTAHYALIGMLGGTLLPLAFALLADGDGKRAPLAFWPLALAVVVLPAGLLLLWGLRAVLGLLLGLAVGQGFLMLVLFLEEERPQGATARAALRAPFAPLLLLAVAAIQLLPPLAPLVQDLTRAGRGVALLACAALLTLAVVAAGSRARQSS